MRSIPLVLGVLLLASAAHARTSPSLSGGVRVGYSNTEFKGIFRQIEGTLRYDLAPVWEHGPGWALRLGVEVTAGAVGNRYDTSGLIGSGLHLALGVWRGRITFDTGTSVTMLTDHTFGPRISLGSPAQFITHWRLRFEFFSVLGLAYRYQHMSNGGLGLDNPGLNLHMLEITVGR
jgi:hypothetical protein